MDMAELTKLPLAQRLEAMEVLWDSLTHDESYDPSPAWHAELLAERVRDIQAGKTMPWDEAKTQIFAQAAQIKQNHLHV
jgi:putative addiction module component (TIGR02574 family)